MLIKCIRRILSAAVAVLMVLTPVLTYADPSDVTYITEVPTVAEGYIVYDITDQSVILSKNADQQYYPASITKTMTALLVCELVEDLDQEITFSAEALAEMTSDSSTLGPRAVEGETMTYWDALFGMFLISSNECAAQLAISTAGSREAFADLMNEKAKEIGCTNTHFVNAHGLHDDNHYTTPHDMALIWGEAIKNPTFLKLATTYEYTIKATNKYDQDRELYTGHSIVGGSIPYAEVYAGKTGRTPQAGRTLCTLARFNDHDVVVVIMKSTDDDFYNDTLLLLEYARGYMDGLYTDMTWEEKEDVCYVRYTNSLKVRAYPSTVGTKVVGVLQYGQQVDRVATWGDWSMINYMDEYYYVYSAYLSEEEPEGTYDPSERMETTARETVDISIIASTDEETLEASSDESSSEESAAVYDTEEESYTRNPDLSIDDHSDDLHEGSSNSIIRVILTVCILLMILIAAGFVWMSVNERKKKKRRRRINTDEWYNK